MASEILTIKTN